jgi:hypothetical protein
MTRLRTITKGGTQKLAETFKIVETYWRDHPLESSDDAISFSIQPFSVGKCIFWFLSKNLLSLKSQSGISLVWNLGV